MSSVIFSPGGTRRSAGFSHPRPAVILKGEFRLAGAGGGSSWARSSTSTGSANSAGATRRRATPLRTGRSTAAPRASAAAKRTRRRGARRNWTTGSSTDAVRRRPTARREKRPDLFGGRSRPHHRAHHRDAPGAGVETGAEIARVDAAQRHDRDAAACPHFAQHRHAQRRAVAGLAGGREHRAEGGIIDRKS